MQQNAYICFQVLYVSKYLYIWLNIAIYTHICTILVPKRCATPIHSTFTARKLVRATLVWCSAIQLPCRGLEHQQNYPDSWTTN